MVQKSLVHYCKDITCLAIPILCVRLLHIAISFIGMIFIAKLGKTELAAGALVTPLSTTVLVIAMSPLLAVGIIISRCVGENKTLEIGDVLRQAWFVSIIMGLIGSLLFWHMDKLLLLLDQPKELTPLMQAYFHGLAWGVIPIFLMASSHQLVFPLRKGNLVIIWSLATLLMTVLLGVALVFGIGLPKLGISGWSYAISIINWIMLAWVIGYLWYHPIFKPLKLFNFKQWTNHGALRAFFKLSFPITLQFANELLAFSFLSVMVGWLGVGALSVQQIVIQCTIVALIIPMSIGQAASILIGHTLGRKEHLNVRRICVASVSMVSVCMLVLVVIYLVWPLSVISLYLSASQIDLIHLAVMMLAIAAFSQFVDAIRNVLMSTLRGLHDVWKPMWISLIILWGGALPIGYLLAFPFKLGLAGLNMGFLMAFTVGAILMFRRFRQKTQQYQSVNAAVDLEIAKA